MKRNKSRSRVSRGGKFASRPPAQKAGPSRRRERQSSFQVLADDLMEGIAVHRGGKVLQVNQSCAAMLGANLEEMVGKNILEFVAPESRELVEKHISQNTRQAYEFVALRKDGSSFCAEAMAKNCRYAGAPARLKALRDISSRKSAEQRLKETVELYRGLVKASPEAIAIIELNGRYLELSQKNVEMLGYQSAEEIIGKSVFSIFPAEELERARKRFPEMVREGGSQRAEYRMQRKDGTLFYGEISTAVVKDAAGNPKAIIGISRDITERRRMEDAVKEAAELYNTFMQASPDAVGLIDLNGRYTNVSRKMLELHGFEKAEEMLGRSVLELVVEPSLEKAQARLHDLVHKQEPGVRREYTLLRKDGSTFIGEMNTAVVRDAHGQPRGVIGISRDITDRKKAEEALRESIELYQKLVKTSPDAVIIFDLEGNIIEVSERLIAIFQIKHQEDFIGKNIFQMAAVNDQAKLRAAMKKTLKAGLVENLEFELVRSGPSQMFLESNLSLVRDAYGDPKAFICTIRDVTERKGAEQAVRETMELYQKLVKTSPDAVIITDLRGTITEVSEQAVKAQKVNGPEDLVGRSAFEFISPEEHEHAKANLRQTLEQGVSETLEYKMRRLDGSSYIGEMKAALVKDSSNQPKAFIATVRDITERKKAEEAIRDSEERFRTLVNSMDDIVVNMDLDLRYTGVYGRWLGRLGDQYGKILERIKGLNLVEIIEVSGVIVSTAKEERDRLHQRALRGENVVYGTTIQLNNNTYHFQVSLSPVKNAQGKITGLVGVCRDISALKKIEENLARAEKLESLGILAGGIAHDFNNILTAIAGNISLAKLRGQSDEKAFASLEEAEKAAMRAKDLTNQLLTFAKGGEPVKRIISIEELIRDSCNFLLRNSRSRCEFSLPDNLWAVDADESQLGQVFHNLVINADQAMPEGGIISVKCENAVLPENNEWQLKPGKYVKIIFEDQGVGIPKSYQSRIFDPFFTTKHKGSGLGLTITYSIIKKHDGRISVNSEPGRGSIFEIYLPASEQPVQPRLETETRPQTGKGKILVMDDDEGIRRVAAGLLEHLGYEVSLAGDGAEAIQLCMSRPETTAEPLTL